MDLANHIKKCNCSVGTIHQNDMVAHNLRGVFKL